VGSKDSVRRVNYVSFDRSMDAGGSILLSRRRNVPRDGQAVESKLGLIVKFTVAKKSHHVFEMVHVIGTKDETNILPHGKDVERGNLG